MSTNSCPLCKRPLILGPSVDKHHLIPKSLGGKDVIEVHKICHQKIHSLFSERELLKNYNTIEKLLTHPDIINFVKWVQKKAPEYVDSNIRANRKKY